MFIAYFEKLRFDYLTGVQYDVYPPIGLEIIGNYDNFKGFLLVHRIVKIAITATRKWTCRRKFYFLQIVAFLCTRITPKIRKYIGQCAFDQFYRFYGTL